MALEAVVYPQDPLSSYVFDDFPTVGGGGSYGFCLQNEDKAFLGIFDNSTNWDSSSTNSIMQHSYSSPETCTVDRSLPAARVIPEPPASATNNRRKRRRTRSSKNKEELENQRMTHITVERNRRKQMNEYLAVLKSLMPSSYVQRGDQASIIGGAIDFVKELEQQLQSMKAHKQPVHDGCYVSPFAEFFTFPQFSTRTTQSSNDRPQSTAAESAADIEVTMVETHANVKILSKKRPRQLLKVVAGLQGLRLAVLHLNVTTVSEMALYSISVKVEEGCRMNTVDEIAGAVNQILGRIQEEAAF
ncbi:hypothetical protein like AT1G72210 [Hibiscus trionum]|uniref:BHLH domain-containing protein n=1 Tax=Hibiscus trionum TaxID=183268 RepID=A0A9W7HJA2_HIBTR|nr:hypothetical protein like AT1G72210 [Hibiscus trionum]